MNKIKAFFSDESGMETLEYALIAGLVAIVAVTVYGSTWDDELLERLMSATTGTAPAP